MRTKQRNKTSSKPASGRWLRLIVGSMLLAASIGLTSCAWFPWTQETVLGLVPASGAVHTVVNLVGEGFGDLQGDGVVMFGGLEADVETWSDMLIVARVPVLPTPNGDEQPTQVGVWRGGEELAAGVFTVVRGVLFTTRRNGNFEIYVMNPDGSQQINLTSHPDSDTYGCWSPDGTKIAFVSHRDGNGEIYVMNADGSAPTNLTRHAAGDWHPCWSPDGSRIAFQTDREGPMLAVEEISPKIIFPFNVEIFVMNADGSGQVNLTNHPSWDGFPSWTSDGNQIAFQTDRHASSVMLMDIVDMGFEIYIMNANGSAQTRLTYTEGNDTIPSCSPTGSTIVYQSSDGGDWEICTVRTNGSARAMLTQNEVSDSAPSWSPDGEWIAFHSMRDGNQEIYKMRPDGTQQTRLTTNPEWDWGASWSGDSSMIVFESWRDAGGGGEIYRMNADGSSARRLTSDPNWDTYPVWLTLPWESPA